MPENLRPERLRVRVVVAAEHGLVGDAVSAALADRGLRTGRLPWAEPRALTAVDDESGPVVGLLLSDLQPGARLQTALALVEHLPLPWVVATGAVRGPLWGAMLERGAAVVLSSATSVDTMVSVLTDVVTGRRLPEAGVAELRGAWQAVQAAQRRLEARLRLLTPRERSVLRRLHAGDAVRSIAAADVVSEATVRSHVRAVLRKLEVRSQLAAVAAYAEHAAVQTAYESEDDEDVPLAVVIGPAS